MIIYNIQCFIQYNRELTVIEESHTLVVRPRIPIAKHDSLG
jgi:hypothetical protein